MKHAILITAYKDIDFINRIIDYFDEDFDFFIHIDKKCKEEYNIKNASNIFIVNKWKRYWQYTRVLPMRFGLRYVLIHVPHRIVKNTIMKSRKVN